MADIDSLSPDAKKGANRVIGEISDEDLVTLGGDKAPSSAIEAIGKKAAGKAKAIREPSKIKTIFTNHTTHIVLAIVGTQLFNSYFLNKSDKAQRPIRTTAVAPAPDTSSSNTSESDRNLALAKAQIKQLQAKINELTPDPFAELQYGVHPADPGTDILKMPLEAFQGMDEREMAEYIKLVVAARELGHDFDIIFKDLKAHEFVTITDDFTATAGLPATVTAIEWALQHAESYNGNIAYRIEKGADGKDYIFVDPDADRQDMYSIELTQ